MIVDQLNKILDVLGKYTNVYTMLPRLTLLKGTPEEEVIQKVGSEKVRA